MIKKVSITISFPQGANFIDGINEIIYRRFINFVKDISCICIDCRCKECNEKEICKYFKLTGRNFSDYSGIIIKNDFFDKRNYSCNEQKKFVFYFVGEMGKYTEYITIFFEQMNQMILNNLFYLKEINTESLDSAFLKCNGLRIKTPIVSKDFIQEYNQQITYYNQFYKTDFSLIDGEAKIEFEQKIELTPFKAKTKNVSINGYVGNIRFKQPILLDKRLLEIGIGKFNFIGGGLIEIES